MQRYVADPFQSSRLFEQCSDAAGDVERLLVIGTSLIGIGDRMQIAKVIQDLCLAEAMTEAAVQLKRFG